MQCCYRLRNCMRAEHEGATLSPAAAQAATVLVCVARTLCLLLSYPSYDGQDTACTHVMSSHNGTRCVFCCCGQVLLLSSFLYVMPCLSALRASSQPVVTAASCGFRLYIGFREILASFTTYTMSGRNRLAHPRCVLAPSSYFYPSSDLFRSIFFA